jgi:hypothetical protein
MGKQPIRPLRINRRHPMARGLIGFYVLNSPGLVRNLAVESRRGTWNADSIVQTPYGQATRFNGSGEIDLGTNEAALSMAGLRGFTISTRARRATSISNSLPTIFGKTDNNNLGQAYSFYVSEGGNQLRFFNKAAASGFQSSRMGIDVPANDTWFLGTASMIRTNDQNLGLMSIDGIQKTISWENARVYQSLSTTAATEYIGSWKPRSSSSWDGDIEFVAIWDRGFTEAEHAAFADDPYQITEPLYDHLKPVSKASTAVDVSGTDISTTPTVGVGTITQTHLVSGSDISATPSLDAGSITQTHAISGTDISAAPSVGAGTITQTHLVSGMDISAMPTVGVGTALEVGQARAAVMRLGPTEAAFAGGASSAAIGGIATSATIGNDGKTGA